MACPGRPITTLPLPRQPRLRRTLRLATPSLHPSLLPSPPTFTPPTLLSSSALLPLPCRRNPPPSLRLPLRARPPRSTTSPRARNPSLRRGTARSLLPLLVLILRLASSAVGKARSPSRWTEGRERLTSPRRSRSGNCSGSRPRGNSLSTFSVSSWQVSTIHIDEYGSISV